MPVHEVIDSRYHLTELGKQLAAKVVKGVPEVTADDILEIVTRPGPARTESEGQARMSAQPGSIVRARRRM